MIVIGLSPMPVVGHVPATPMLALAAYFYRVHRNHRCRTEDQAKAG